MAQHQNSTMKSNTMEIRATTFYSIFLACFATAEPLLRLPLHSDSLSKRDTAWTALAWQTTCDNINFQDYTDCCQKKSGPNWRSCNNVGSWMLGSSDVLCYSIPEGHTCCADNSVCDKGLSCSGGTCSQNKDSVTICEDGCVSFAGQGCKGGTCNLDQYGETTKTEPSPTIGFKPGTQTPKSESSPTPKPSSSSGGLGTGAIAGIVISAVVTILVGIFSCWLKYKRTQKKMREDTIKTQAKIDRINSAPAGSPVLSPAMPFPPPHNPSPVYGGGARGYWF